MTEKDTPTEATAPVKPKKRLLTRRNFLRACAGGIATGVVCYGYGSLIEVHRLVVEHITIPIPGLAPSCEGKRLVQLSDFHAGRTSITHIQRALGIAADLKPDYLLITGDTIDVSLDRLPAVCNLLRDITQKIPTYACTGNHDYSADKAYNAVNTCEALSRAGVHMLRNQFHQPLAGPGELCFAGIDDLWHGQSDPSILAKAPADSSVILLNHNPDAYEAAAKYRWHLMLSGHTHGGQVCIPGFGPLILPIDNRERAAGSFHLDPAQPHRALYVNRGIGHLLKVRFWCPPEITCFTLKRA